MIKCLNCNADPSQPDETTVVLRRVNEFGVIREWLCDYCLRHSLELFEGKPHFLHAIDCPNYCDYACNPKGFEQAEQILKYHETYKAV